MQVHKFDNGYYVAHRVRLSGYSPMRFSVWYHPDGRVLDAEAFDSTGRRHNVGRENMQRLAARFPTVETAYRVMSHFEGY